MPFAIWKSIRNYLYAKCVRMRFLLTFRRNFRYIPRANTTPTRWHPSRFILSALASSPNAHTHTRKGRGQQSESQRAITINPHEPKIVCSPQVLCDSFCLHLLTHTPRCVALCLPVSHTEKAHGRGIYVIVHPAACVRASYDRKRRSERRAAGAAGNTERIFD